MPPRLRSLLGDPTASFRSREQALAIPLIMDRKLDLLVIMPTGMGKSVLFSLPPLL
ncbi:hypothetical protein BDB00DRAFT_856793, partial [Zychaea mexicana]|uniref:uncharacterized protein n=1 Tax=Zychaea mexicana TaxID=64656 RepID=UPI0022FF1E1C